jgi:hypothetical protein
MELISYVQKIFFSGTDFCVGNTSSDKYAASYMYSLKLQLKNGAIILDLYKVHHK